MKLRLAFATVALLHLAPLIAFRYFVSQDGPAHVGNAFVLGHYSVSDLSSLREYFALNLSPFPNWLGHVVLAVLLHVTDPPSAERLLVAGLVLGLPLALRYAVSGVSEDGGAFAFAAFPCCYSFVMHMGFYSFTAGLVVSLLVIGRWLRRPENPSWRARGGCAALGLLLYFCHLVPFVLAGLVLATLSVVSVFSRGARRSTARSLGVDLAIVFLPASLFSVWFLSTSAREGIPWREPTGEAVRKLFTLDALVCFDSREAVLAILVAAVLLGFALLALGRGTIGRGSRPSALGVSVLVILAVYVVAPSQAGGGSYVKERIALFLVLLLPLWLASHRFSSAERAAFAVGLTGLSLGLIGCRWRVYERANVALKDYVSCAGALQVDRTLVTMPYSTRLADPGDHDLGRIKPLLHASGYLVALRGLVDLKDYEAARAHFPLRYRDERNPFKYLSHGEDDMKREPPRVDLATYRRDHGRIDYVLVWDAPGSVRVPGFAAFDQCPQGPTRARVYVPASP